MYLKQLLVIKNGVILRNINFHKGLNLIIDETKEEGSTTTGNNVGKTTVLKLIYFCFGGDPKEIYTSTEVNHIEKLMERNIQKKSLLRN